MRRKLGFILLAGSILVGSAALIGQALTGLDTDFSYGSGKDFYFVITDGDSADSTYNGVKVQDYIQDDDYEAVNAVADEMKKRLQEWDIDAEVSKEGFYTVKVSLRSEGADTTEYDYLKRYLAFSGGNITVGIGSTDEDIQKEADDKFSGAEYSDNAMFEGNKAEITYVNSIPVVTIAVNSPKKDGAFDQLVQFCGEEGHNQEADESAGTQSVNTYIVLWANKQTTDNFTNANKASGETGYDPNMTSRLIFGEAYSNAWYTPADEDEHYKKMQIVPNSEALTNSGYDASKAGAAYKAAKYYKCIMNASDYGSILGDERGVSVAFSYESTTQAAVESLIHLGDWNAYPAFNMTLIACLIGALAGIALIAVAYRWGALAIAGNISLSLIATLFLFGHFSAQFGIGAIVGIVLGALGIAFGGIYYFAKFKEELYAGRGPKKAHAEAIKKALWPSLDAGIISIVLGLCVYGLVPASIGMGGLTLVLMGFFGTVCNIILLRIEGYMLANDKGVAAHLGRNYGVDEKKLVNGMEGEKQTYFGPYAGKDLSKGHNIIGIVAAVLAIASIVGISIFTFKNGDAYNYAGAYEDTTSISIEYRVEAEAANERGKDLDEISDLTNSSGTGLLDVIEIDGKALPSYFDTDSIVKETGTLVDSSVDPVVSYTVYYYDIPLNTHFDFDGKSHVISLEGSSGYDTLSEALKERAKDFLNDESGDLHFASVNNVVVEAGTPSLGKVYIGIGVALASLFVYFALRFKISRSLMVTAISGASGLLVAGLFALTRIPVTPMVSLAIVAATFLGFILPVFYLQKAKEIKKDSRERDKNSLEFEETCTNRAVSEGVGDSLIFATISLLVFILMFALFPRTFANVFLGSSVSIIFIFFLATSIIAPYAIGMGRLFHKIKDNFHPFRREVKSGMKGGKKNTSEPEEAVFIGIND